MALSTSTNTTNIAYIQQYQQHTGGINKLCRHPISTTIDGLLEAIDFPLEPDLVATPAIF